MLCTPFNQVPILHPWESPHATAIPFWASQNQTLFQVLSLLDSDRFPPASYTPPNWGRLDTSTNVPNPWLAWMDSHPANSIPRDQTMGQRQSADQLLKPAYALIACLRHYNYSSEAILRYETNPNTEQPPTGCPYRVLDVRFNSAMLQSVLSLLRITDIMRVRQEHLQLF